jgi:Putative auto-transporter adhesin, head GIN domain
MNSLKRFVPGFSRACCLLPLLLAGCNVSLGPSLRGSGVAKTESRQAASFSEIEVGSAIRLDVNAGHPTSLSVTADDNILPLVRTEVVGDRLKIYVDAPYSSGVGVEVNASTPELNALLGTGASTISTTGIDAGKFRLELHGASTGEFSGHADVMDVTLTGASGAVLSGTCEQLNVACAGASHLKAADFAAEKVTAVLSGASSAQVNASEELTANASGASHLRYVGQPAKLNKHVNGASTVSAQ